MPIYGSQFTFTRTNETIVELICCPSFALHRLCENTFEDNLQFLLRTMNHNNDSFVVFVMMQFCNSIEKNNHNIFLAQLRYFISDSNNFSPLNFQTAYDTLDFSSIMNYKSFLQKISHDHYGKIVFNLTDRNMKQNQINPFCRLDTSLKILMRNLTMDNWTLLKYMIGDHVIIANNKNIEMLKVRYDECSNVFEDFNKFIASIKLQQQSDFIFKNRHMYKYIESNNLKIVNEAIPMILREQVGNMFVMIENKKMYIRDLTVVCFCYKTKQLGQLNLRLGTKCVFGNKQTLYHKYH